jgi:hypothetical protein
VRQLRISIARVPWVDNKHLDVENVAIGKRYWSVFR